MSAERSAAQDRAGFHRRWGVYIHREPRRSPFVSLGVHLDWHTPTLDLYLVRWVVQIGRNVWQEGRRFVYHDSGYASGHTDQCLCEREAEPSTEGGTVPNEPHICHPEQTDEQTATCPVCHAVYALDEEATADERSYVDA